MNTRFTKKINGITIIETRNNIVLNINETIQDPKTGEMIDVITQTFNPSNELLFEDGWILYEEPEPTEEDIFNEAKKELISNIEYYDSSSDVNMFFIQGLPVWLDKATRAGLKLRFEAEIAMGKTETALWYDSLQFPLPLDTAIQMLYAIEVYASECYDNTQAHLANVNVINNLEELQNYDYTSGYPEKLNF
jgi:hypothetical protein